LSGIGFLSFEYDPEACLSDILDDIARAERFMAGMSREAFAANEMAVYAAERCLERICEAVFRLGPRMTELMPNQPAAKIRGMGNRLRHAYDNVDLDFVWDTLQESLPSLKADAERALATLRSPGSSSS
jgi:uncharacterized protein with HEPN domain